MAVCGQCGIRGKLVTEDGKVRFTFDESQIEHAHDTLSGQFIHADDIQNNEKMQVLLQEVMNIKQKYSVMLRLSQQ